MSTAKSAINSTIRRILSYTAEIIMSIILLVIICIPLAITIPMWLQYVLLGTPKTELTINLVSWFGYDGALWITLFLGLVGFSLSYVYILKMKPGFIPTTDEKIVVKESDIPKEEDEISAAEDMEEEEFTVEDQEEDEEERLDLDDIEVALEDMEEDEEESEEYD
ncbi:MAG: hypothetical protein ACFFCT_00290 [Candidatus Odinarchaeota archaeon]